MHGGVIVIHLLSESICHLGHIYISIRQGEVCQGRALDIGEHGLKVGEREHHSLALIIGRLFCHELFAVAVNLLSYAMTEIIGFFSSFDAATVSLRYFFADIIVYAFVSICVVFMIIKLKRKWIMIIKKHY